jgi:predicted metal-dependent peptidase
MKQITQDDRVVRKFKKARIDLMRCAQFMELGPVMRLGKQHIVLEGVSTACTDGINETYNYRFIDALTPSALGFVICHETMHKVARHTVTYRKLWEEDAQLANMACDYWINGRLDNIANEKKQDGHVNIAISMPRITDAVWEILDERTQAALLAEGKQIGDIFGLLDHRFDGMSVKEIFDILKKEGKGKKGGKGQGDGEGAGDTGFDEHDWEKANELSAEQIEEARGEIERALREGKMLAQRAGLGEGGRALGLDDLLKPKVDWRSQLRDFMRSTCRKPQVSTWRRPNRRFLHQGIIMPTMQGKSIKALAVCPDASGSMFCGSPTPFQMVMSEVEGMVQQLNVDIIHLIYWDGWVCRHETYTPATIKQWRDTTKPSGGGGTNPECVAKYLLEKQIKVDAAVILTDGDVMGWGTWHVPTLWAITGKNTSPVGKTIRVTRD